MLRHAHISSKLTGAVLIGITSLAIVSAQQTSSESKRSDDIAAGVGMESRPPVMQRTPTSIVAAFVKAESRVRAALNQHTFKREVVLQTIGPNGKVTGEYVRDSRFIFDDSGNRIERVSYHPPSTIRAMRITKEDIQDLAGAQLLGIDVVDAPKYRLTYAGEDILASKRVYVLLVEPASKPDPHRMKERFFRGRVWIDAENFQIIKVKGVVEPNGKQRFPIFETWREPVGALYFPTKTEADDVLHFPGRDVTYRIRARYFDYKLFASKLKVTELNEPAN
jgi:hypothetical protein